MTVDCLACKRSQVAAGKCCVRLAEWTRRRTARLAFTQLRICSELTQLFQIGHQGIPRPSLIHKNADWITGLLAWNNFRLRP
jgi:hypothetical protein